MSYHQRLAGADVEAYQLVTRALRRSPKRPELLGLRRMLDLDEACRHLESGDAEPGSPEHFAWRFMIDLKNREFLRVLTWP